MRVFPNDDYVAVVLDKPESITEGGIVLPENAQRPTDLPISGTVMCVGPGRWEGATRIPVEFKAGARVILVPYAGYNYVHEETLLRIVKSSDILACLAE